jgi:PAS domain S-box-containing protein
MSEERRASGIELIGSVPWGTHLCQFYQTKEDLIDILVPYFQAGLEQNEFCMWVTSEPLNVEAAKASLQAVVKDLESYIQQGQIEILDYSEWYTKTGRFESNTVLEGWVQKEREAVQRGFDGLRLSGNTFWLEKKDWKAFTEYEARIDRVIGRYRMIAICTYSLEKCGAFEVIDVVSNHECALIRQEGEWKTIESFRRKRAEEALRESEEKYRRLFEEAMDGIGLADAETGVLLDCNKALGELVGRETSELIGQSQKVLHPSEDINGKVSQSFAQHRSDKVGQVLETRVITRAGETKDVEIKANILELQGRRILQGIFRDITERQRAEEALRASEERYRRMFQAASVSLWEEDVSNLIVALDTLKQQGVPDLRTYLDEHPEFVRQAIHTITVLDVNDMTLQLYGARTKEELLGALDKTLAPEALPYFKEQILAIAEQKPYFEKESWAYTLQGEKINIFVSVTIPQTPAKFGMMLVSVADITERKRAEVELQKYHEHLEELVQERTNELIQTNKQLEQEIIERKRIEAEIVASAQRFWTVIETVGEGITLSNETGYFEIFNSKMEEITGYTRDEANKSGDFLRYLYPDSADYYRAHNGIQEILRTGGNRDIETTIRAKDGASKTLLVSTSIVRDQDRNWFLSAYRDITERKRTEKELQQAKEVADTASRAKTEFLANMSHELRTPLNAILGYAQILKDNENLTERQRNGLETIRSSGKHLLNLITEILDLSKIEAGRMELQLSELHLPEFLKHIADMTQIRAQQKGIAFVYENDLDLPIGVRADEKRLQEVLLNLLGNAVKFTEKGKVTFRVRSNRFSDLKVRSNDFSRYTDKTTAKAVTTNPNIRFEVEDTGIGIAPEHLEEIFSPFHQVTEQRYAIEGTGLGLSISRRLVEMMGSELYVQSTVGKGSVFWFELNLPIVEGVIVSAYPERNRRESQKIVGYQGERRTVLVVDDEATNRALLLGILLPLGFKIAEAENGQECVEKTLKYHPDLILMDLRMPVLDGFGATERIRNEELRMRNEDKSAIRTVIIAVSAMVFEETRKRALAIGFDDFLIKPFQLENLLELFQTHLGLEWIYEEEPQARPGVEDQADSDVLPLISLPPNEAENLIEFARLGYVKGILLVLNKIEQRDAQYLPAVNKLRTLARKYQFEQIVEFLKQSV